MNAAAAGPVERSRERRARRVVHRAAGRALAALAAFALIGPGSPARGATLPSHPPLRVLVVSDEVNPHGLPDGDLTQPGEISVALRAACNGLRLDPAADGVVEIATDDLADATALLAVPIDDPAAYDVVVYFAHRIPNGPGGGAEQEAFVDALEAFLVAGGGMISFHHGSYATAGKASVLELVGGTAAGAVPWNTVDGQNVIAVAPAHFVAANGVVPDGNLTYQDLPRGVPSASYPYFNNTPDERYPSFEINPSAGDVELLFASDYDQGGTTHVLGFTHRRAGWAGVVVAYQPGEYQPNALDDLAGNNFQILANALVWAAPPDAAWIFADGFECGLGGWAASP